MKCWKCAQLIWVCAGGGVPGSGVVNTNSSL